MDLADLSPDLMAERPHLFSSTVVELSARDIECMRSVVTAVEHVVALPAYQELALSAGPDTARHRSPAVGVFFGYDFHLAAEGPRLIEINTNAGGALLAAAQANAPVEDRFMDMFRSECSGQLKTLAIVDESPETQYLYPEFLLFKKLFERFGVDVVICDPQELMLCHGGLWYEDRRLDLVYNRLTDFSLFEQDNAALRQAWLDDAVVVTPHPRAHALYADKRNLVTLSDGDRLRNLGVTPQDIEVLLAGVPRTERVVPEHADSLWSRRRDLFFKPAAGYGSKAAYRGDKMTRRVFEEVLAGNYVAQALVPPSMVPVAATGDGQVQLKADIRCYAYRGQVQLVAARLWQGQTTNFRTPGGGFARVKVA